MIFPTKAKLMWSILQGVWWATTLLFPAEFQPSDGMWFYLAFPARLAFAWWFVSAVRSSQQNYQKWREEVLHGRIQPILTEPPEVAK